MQHNRPAVGDDTNVFVEVIHHYNIISSGVAIQVA